MAVEEPLYTVSLQDGTIEVRDYPALIAAEVKVSGDPCGGDKNRL